MKILVVSGYNAWEKVSQDLMPSHHLYGIHEMIDHYEKGTSGLRGILKTSVCKSGYVDFYLWKGGAKNIFKQVIYLAKLSKQYDIIYDQLNRCSIYLGFFKKLGIFKTKIITILHHPPYSIQLKVSNSDAYIFFNSDYKQLAVISNSKKSERYFVNEWAPDYEWYQKALKSYVKSDTDVKFIDTGKSRRDRQLVIKTAEETKIRIDYAGDENQTDGFARSYCVDLKDDIGMIHRIMNYQTVLIPVLKNGKNKVGPLGITSYLDCLALGKPLIASDNVCFAKEVRDKKLGLLYKTGDKESFKKAITFLNENIDFYNEYQNNICNYKPRTMAEYSDTILKILLGLIRNGGEINERN